MTTIENRLNAIGDIIDDFSEVKGVKWLSSAHEIMDDSSEILIQHKKTDDGENEYSVREYPLRQNIPHKQARLSERKWSGDDPDDAISQRVRLVFPNLRLETERMGLSEFDIVWISRRVGRLIEQKTLMSVNDTKDMIGYDG